MASTYTVVYGTLDQLPDDGPGIYNRPADPDCKHPLGMRWWIWNGDVLTPNNKIAAPRAVICLCCGCAVPEIAKKPRPVPTRDECDAMMHAEFLRHWSERDMPFSTVARTLYYLFGACRAFPRPDSYYRGRAVRDPRLAKLRGVPRRMPTALSTARRYRAEGRIAAFPRSLARLSAAIIATTDPKSARIFNMRRPVWMGRAIR